MPQLPQYTSQLQAQANRRIIDIPVPEADTSMGDALQRVAHIGMEVAGRIQKANVDREVVSATRIAREQYEKAKYDLEQNHDIPDGEIETTLRKQGEDILSKVGEGISSKTARDMWSENAKGTLLLEGDDWARKTAQSRGIDRVKGSHVAAISDLETKAGDLSISSDAYEKSVQDERGAILRNKDRGFLKEEQAAQLLAGLDKLSLKDRTMRWSSNIDALVKEGRIAEAQAMFDAGAGRVDPDTRATVKKGLDASKQDYAVVAKTDELWGQAKGDLGKFLKLSAKIEDAPLRQKVEERGNRMRLLEDQAENQRQDNLQRQMWAHVEGGGTIANAPAALRGAIDPTRLGSIRAYEEARDREKALSPAALAQWKDDSARIRMRLESSLIMPPQVFMSDPSTWAPDHFAAYQTMTADDQRAVDEKRQKMVETGGSVDEVTRIERLLWDEAKRTAPPGWNLGSQKDQKTPQYTQAAGLIREQAALMAKDMGGKPLTPDEVRRGVGFAFGRMNEGKDLSVARWAAYGEKFRPLGSADPNAIGGDIDPDLYADAFKAVQAKYPGQMPPMAEVRAAYDQLLAAGGQ